MTTYTISQSEKLHQFLNEHADDHYCMGLLRFLGAHPHVWFDRLVIVHAIEVDCGKLNLERNLRLLVDQGWARTKTENNVLLYSLSDDEPLRSLSLELATYA